jgi:hypothetical protein
MEDPDVYLGSRAVRKRYDNISDMTLDRWVAAGILPPPEYFGRLKMWKRSVLEANERSLNGRRTQARPASKSQTAEVTA